MVVKVFREGLGIGILIGSVMGTFFTLLCVISGRGNKDEDDKG